MIEKYFAAIFTYFFIIIIYGKNKANELTGYLIVNDHRRPRPSIPLEELQMRCRTLRN